MLDNLMLIIYYPLGMLFKLCYMIIQDYGVAILLFAVIAKLVLLPLSIKNEKGRLKMQAVQPKMKALQDKYKGNTRDPKYSEEMQKLYEQEGYNPMSGCLPQLIQLPIILGLWNAIRNPLTYISGFTNNKVAEIGKAFLDAGKLPGNVTETNLSSWLATNQISLVDLLNNQRDVISAVDIGSYTNINLNIFGFLGDIVGTNPQWNNWTIIIPIISGITSFLVGYISTKMNAPKDDPEAAKAMKKSMGAMLYIMPLISVWIAFSFTIAIAFYWIVSNLLSMLQAVLLPKYMDMKESRRKAKEPVVVKEKKLNYNQIEKMEREKKMKEKNGEKDETVLEVKQEDYKINNEDEK
ncbi:MAG: hypothetical protein DBX47_03285 [Clostridiales bacterium]|nr:MAG: hypothetical protein DBX47_03285 [Clostridiales bacterium]